MEIISAICSILHSTNSYSPDCSDCRRPDGRHVRMDEIAHALFCARFDWQPTQYLGSLFHDDWRPANHGTYHRQPFPFMISDLQPQSAFGQLAVKRLGSQQSWLAHILFLFLSSIAYSLIVFLTMHLTGRLLGLPFSNQWSIYRNSAEHINIPVFLTIPELTHFQAFLAFWDVDARFLQ